jgi:hypothetical protein|tara:strand:- start:896 stop:1399 length:504 start_codon:yes stop_codon:yes gene_type:complete
MMKQFQQMALFILLLSVIGLTACSNDTKTEPDAKLARTKEAMQLAVYKSPDCGCCGLWMDHIESLGFITKTHHPADLNKIKHTLGVQRQYQSCHTAVSTEGYVFEGHIPAPVMQRFLAEKPQGALGLAVPGMPLGSPGMEMGNKRDDYDVLLLKKDGSSTVYERIRH